MESWLDRPRRLQAGIEVFVPRAKLERNLYALILGLGGCSLESSTDGGAVRADFLQVHSGRDHLDVKKTELRSLGDHVSIHQNHAATIVKQSVAVTLRFVNKKQSTYVRVLTNPFLVGIKVNAATFSCGLRDELQAKIQFLERLEVLMSACITTEREETSVLTK